MQIANLVVRFTSDLTGLQRGFAEATRSAATFSDRMASIGTTLTASLTLPLVGLGAAAFNAGVRLDAMRASLVAIMGSSERAERELANLRETARLPGLGFEQAVRGSTALQAVGFSAKLARDALTGFGNAVAITGGGAPELERVITQLSQMAAAGKVLTQDLRPIIQTAPAVGKALTQAFGTINAAKIEEMGLSTEEFMTRFIAAVNELPKTSGGARTAMENLREAWGDLMRAFSENVMPSAVSMMKDVAKRLEEWAAAFGKLTPEQQRFRLGLAALIAALPPAIILFGYTVTALRALNTALGVTTILRTTAAWFALVPSIRSARDAYVLLQFAVMGTARALGIASAVTAVAAWLRLIPAIRSAADAFVLLRMAIVGVTTSMGPLGIAVAVLGAVSYAFWKTGESARQAAAQAAIAASEFRAALADMDQAGLAGAASMRQQALPRIQEEMDATARELAAAREAVRRAQGTVPRITRSDLALPSSPQMNKATADVERLRTRLAALTEQYNTTLTEARLAAEQYNRTVVSFAPNSFAPQTPDTDGGKDKLRAARETIEAYVREMQSLQRFGGALTLDVLPENVQEKIRDFDALRERTDRLADALRQMGAAAPAEGFLALRQLQTQVEFANAEINALAENFNRALREMAAKPINTQVQVNASAMLTGSSLRGSVDAELGLNRFGASLTATGSLLGDLNAPLLSVSSGLNLLRESALQAGRVLLEALSQAVSAGGQFASNIQNSARDLMQGGASLAQAAPQAIAFASAMEVATSFFQTLAPALDALTLPLRLLGEVLGTLIIPVLRLLFPVFKAVAVVASFLGEIIARVVSAILNAAGGFVRGLGKLINAITPFANPGNPLVKAGEALQRTAGSFSAAADEMKAKRKEIQNLTFADAMDRASNAADRLTESLTNMPPLFDIVLRRIQAARGMSPEPPALRSASVPSFSAQASAPTAAPVLQMIFEKDAFASNPNATAEEIASAVWSRAISRLSLGPAEARTMANTLRIAGVAG